MRFTKTTATLSTFAGVAVCALVFSVLEDFLPKAVAMGIVMLPLGLFMYPSITLTATDRQLVESFKEYLMYWLKAAALVTVFLTFLNIMLRYFDLPEIPGSLQ
jgi:hypothetical protein